MLVQFVTDHEWIMYGFTAKFYFTSINPNCKHWLNITAQILTSPDFPTMNCSWVITASPGSTISIHLHTIEVNHFTNLRLCNYFDWLIIRFIDATFSVNRLKMVF